MDVLHRVAAMASGGMDTLPHNGAVITLLSGTGLTHRQSYRTSSPSQHQDRSGIRDHCRLPPHRHCVSSMVNFYCVGLASVEA